MSNLPYRLPTPIIIDGYKVDLSAGATTGQVLKYDGYAFSAGTGGGGGIGTTGNKFITIIPMGFSTNNNSATPIIVGAVRFNPSDYVVSGTTQSVVFRAVAVNGNSTVTGYVKLRDVTNSVDITTLTITAGTTTEAAFEQALTISSAGSNTIANSAVIYEARIYIGSSTTFTDFIQLYSVELRNINTVN